MQKLTNVYEISEENFALSSISQRWGYHIQIEITDRSYGYRTILFVLYFMFWNLVGDELVLVIAYLSTTYRKHHTFYLWILDKSVFFPFLFKVFISVLYANFLSHVAGAQPKPYSSDEKLQFMLWSREQHNWRKNKKYDDMNGSVD